MPLSFFLSRMFRWGNKHDKTEAAPSPDRKLRGLRGERAFLVFIDSSTETQEAVHYAANRIRHEKGRIILLSVITEQQAGEWIFVESLLEEDAQRRAEEQLEKASQDVYDVSGSVSQLVIKKGDIQSAILSVLRENPDITVLVATPSTSGVGVSNLVRSINNPSNTYLPVPVTIIPKSLGRGERNSDGA